MAELKLSLPVLLDDMAGSAEKSYDAWPDRIVVIDADGRIAYPGKRGPRGFSVADATEVIKNLVAAGLPDTRPAPATQKTPAGEAREPAGPSTRPAAEEPNSPRP